MKRAIQKAAKRTKAASWKVVEGLCDWKAELYYKAKSQAVEVYDGMNATLLGQS